VPIPRSRSFQNACTSSPGVVKSKLPCSSAV
jgi:hypothetical protein